MKLDILMILVAATEPGSSSPGSLTTRVDFLLWEWSSLLVPPPPEPWILDLRSSSASLAASSSPPPSFIPGYGFLCPDLESFIHFFLFQKHLEISYLLIASLLFSSLLWVFILFFLLVLNIFLMRSWERQQKNTFVELAVLNQKILYFCPPPHMIFKRLFYIIFFYR